MIEALRDRIFGRVTAVDVIDPETQETVFETERFAQKNQVERIEKLGIDEVKVRTPLTCDGTLWLVCQVLWSRFGSWRYD